MDETQTSEQPAAATDQSAESATLAETEAVEAVLDIGSKAGADTALTTALMRGRVDRHGVATGTGRRKTAVARVRISDGNGKFTVNGREFADYFPLERNQQMILAPLRAAGAQDKLDIWVRVQGGGPTGQTGAVVLGIARALQAKNPELHEVLSDGGYLTRDGRMVERKKYGYRKARRSFQFSKR